MNDRNEKRTFWMGDRNEDAQRLSRRRLIAALLAFIAYGPFTACAETSGIGDARGSTETGTTETAALREGAEDAFTAWIITDIHYLAEGLHDDGTAYARLLSTGDNKNIAMVGPLMDALAWSMGETADRPDCLIVDGDLTLNGESESHLALAERFKAIEAAGVSVYVLPGNHDLDNPGALSFFGDAAEETRTVSPAEFKSIYGPYGFDEALSRDRESLSYLVQPRPGVRILMLDSTCSDENLDNGYSDAYGCLSESTRAWIAECADGAAAEGARLVAAMHHSLIDHNEVIHAGYTIDDSPGLVSRFSELGVSYVLTGHTHIQDIAQAETPRGPLYDVTTNALSVYPHNYGLLRLSLESGSCRVDYEGRRVDVETWARATGAEDPRLSDFARYSEQFIADHSRRMMGSILNAQQEEERTASGLPIPSAEQVDELVDLLVTLNTRFFAGKENADPGDASEPENVGLLALLPEGFLADYARSISRDQAPADDELHLR